MDNPKLTNRAITDPSGAEASSPGAPRWQAEADRLADTYVSSPIYGKRLAADIAALCQLAASSPPPASVEALRELEREMRHTALVSGQYGVECLDFDAEAHVAYADRLTEWADKLAAALWDTPPAPEAKR